MPAPLLHAGSLDLSQLVGNRHGLIRRRDQGHLTDPGSRLRNLHQKGLLTRLDRGVYIPSEKLEGITPREHYRYRSLALGSRRGKILGGLSAAAVHGLWMVDSAPPTVEFYRPRDRHAGHREGYRQLHGRLPEEQVHEAADVLLTSIPRTIVDLGRYHGFGAAFVALSGALAERRCSRDNVREIVEGARLHGLGEFPLILDGVAANLGSALEAIFHAQVVYYGGFEVIPQYPVRVGANDYYLDFAVKGTHDSVECDGMEKYGTTPEEQRRNLRRQKRRADDLTRMGITSHHFNYSEVVSGHAYRTMLHRLGLPAPPDLPAIYLR